MNHGLEGNKLNGTESFDPLYRQYSEAMWKWVEKTLKSSDEFDFLFVAGHYMLLDEFHFRWFNITLS